MPVDLTLEIRAGTSWADSVLSAVQSDLTRHPRAGHIPAEFAVNVCYKWYSCILPAWPVVL